MTPEQNPASGEPGQSAEPARSGPPATTAPDSGPLNNLDVWARSAPIRLAGYEDDLAEPHILQGVD